MNRSSLSVTAMILAGGLGIRLRPVVSDRPKPMAPVGESPFLELLLLNLAEKGITKAVLLTGHMGEVIEDYFRNNPVPGMAVRCVHEPEPLGTGGAVKHAEAFASDPALLVNGDTFFDADLRRLLEFHERKAADVTISLVWVSDVRRYGSVSIDSAGTITGFQEKSAALHGAGWVNAGLTVLSRSVIRALPADRAFSMEQEIFPVLAARGRMAGLGQSGAFFDIGTPDSYARFQQFTQKVFIGKSRGEFAT